MNTSYVKEQIKQRLSTAEIIEYYLGKPNYVKRWKCPFNHEESNNNLSIKNNMYQCFSCGFKGDGIDFVQRYLNCDYSTALETIAKAFHIYTDPTPKEWQESVKLEWQRQQQRKRDEIRNRQMQQKESEILTTLIEMENMYLELINRYDIDLNESFEDYILTTDFAIFNEALHKLELIDCYFNILYESDYAYDIAERYSGELGYAMLLCNRYISPHDRKNRLIRDCLSGNVDITKLI